MIDFRDFRTSCWAEDSVLCCVVMVAIAYIALGRDRWQRYVGAWNLRSLSKIKEREGGKEAHLVL
jgi:hypothetical protein